MRCIHCDREIPDDSVFCPYCGQDVEEDSLDELQDQLLRQLSREVTGELPSASWDREERREYMRGRRPKQSKRYLGVIGLVVAVMAVFIIVIWMVFTTMDANERRLREEREQAVRERQEVELEAKNKPKDREEDAGETGTDDDREEIKMSFVSEPDDFGEYYKLSVKDAAASSVISQEGTDNGARKAVDGNEKTSWQEGVSGDGIGESLHLELEKAYNVKYMSFQLGNWNSWEYYDGNNRPKELEITVGDVNQTITFPDGKTEYWVEFSKECLASEIDVVIRSVYEGSQWDDTCIAEIGVYGRGN